jgi:hypothetical protein
VLLALKYLKTEREKFCCTFKCPGVGYGQPSSAQNQLQILAKRVWEATVYAR